MPFFSANGQVQLAPQIQVGSYSTPGKNTPGPSRGILARLRQVTSGWLGPRVSEGTEVARELIREKAAGGPRGIFDLPWFLPYIYDNYTQETAAIRQAYRQMWSDSNVKSACAGKIMSVASLDLKFQPANKKNKDSRKHAEFCDYVFNERLKGVMQELVWSILAAACTDGYAVSEKVWAHEDSGRWAGNWVIRALKSKDSLNDLVLQTDPFKNITGIMGLRYNAGMEFSPANFVIFRHMPLFDQPVGMSDFRSVYKDYWLLDTAKKMRAVGLEKRSYPFIIGKWQDATQQPGLEGALAKAKWQNFISIPKTVEADALDLAGQGDRIFDEAIKSLKHDIWLGIRFAVLQSLEGTTTDARGNSQVHKESTEILERFLAAALCQVFNDRESGLIKDVLDPNYIVHEYPKAVISEVDINELEAEARIDQALHTFLPLSMDECYERYGRTPPESPEDTIAPAGAGGMQGGMGGFGGGGRLDMTIPENRLAEFSEGRTSEAEERRKRKATTVVVNTFTELKDKHGESIAQAILAAANKVLGSSGGQVAETFAERSGQTPIINVNGGGSSEPPVVHVHTPAPVVNVQPPEVTVNVPKQEPPSVNVEAPVIYMEPDIHVNVPEQKPPIVKVDVKPAPVEIREAPAKEEKREIKGFTVKRDRHGNIEKVIPE